MKWQQTHESAVTYMYMRCLLFASHCSAEYYVKVMRKIQDKGEEYVTNEHERLGRILGESVAKVAKVTTPRMQYVA